MVDWKDQSPITAFVKMNVDNLTNHQQDLR